MNTPCGDLDLHSAHPWGGDKDGLNWCQGISESDVNDSDLLIALREAEAENTIVRPCQVCVVLESVTEPVKSALKDGLAGTIGRDKLVTILTAHGFTVGRRAVERHRQEGHTS